MGIYVVSAFGYYEYNAAMNIGVQISVQIRAIGHF